MKKTVKLPKFRRYQIDKLVSHHRNLSLFKNCNFSFLSCFNKSKNPLIMKNTMTQEKMELHNLFHSAKSSEKMLKVMKKMGSCFEEDELGFEYFELSKKLLKDGFFEKVLFFGKRVLKILLSKNVPCFETDHICLEHSSSVCVAFVLDLLGNACFELNLFDESLRYLNWAIKNLSKIELDGNSSCGGQCVLGNLCSVHSSLVKVKKKMGRKEDCIVHMLKILEIDELLLEEGCIELGAFNSRVYEWYVWCGHSEEALPFCLKALEIFKGNVGRECELVEVAKTVRDLAVIYNELGEYEKALEQITLAESMLKKTSSRSPDLLKVVTEKGNVLIGLGRYEEAVDVLKGVVSRAPKEGSEQVVALVSMAKAFCDLQKFAEAKEYMIRAGKILERLVVGSTLAATIYGDMSRMHEKMNHFETAISLWSQALIQPELPQKLHAEGVRRILSLASLTEKEKELISFLDDMVEKLKEDLGPNHCEVGYSYARLGLAYMKVGREELAVKFMEDAKDILNTSLGPHHLDSLRTSQMLSVTYETANRHHLANENQKEVIAALKELGPSEQEFMDEAVRLLNRMKKKVPESPTRASFQSKDGKDLSAKISKFGISDDGKLN